MGIGVAGSNFGWKMGGACAPGRPLRISGSGSSINHRVCSFKSNDRTAMSLSQPALLRQFQSWHR